VVGLYLSPHEDNMNASTTDRLRVLLLDAHDSFTHNIAHAYAELGAVVEVKDVDAVEVASAHRHVDDRTLVVVGPGPRGPAQLSSLVELVRHIDGRWPLMGICLGLQVLVAARGGVVGHANVPVHGKRTPITTTISGGLFAGLPSSLWVMRYHSLVATAVPPSLHVTARDEYGQCMAVADKAGRVAAVQFHPESIGTAGGMQILANSFRLARIEAPVVRHRLGHIPPSTDIGPGFPAFVAVLDAIN
jgi:anthranilate synthase/aminodeoxychorismate synthase-like glutamine amidotransferase